MPDKWRYRIYARHSADRYYYQIDVEVASDQDKQVEELKTEFGPKWDIWIDRFPAEHPHAALQRRLAHGQVKGRVRGKPKGDLQIRPEEREDVEEAMNAPPKSPAVTATTET